MILSISKYVENHVLITSSLSLVSSDTKIISPKSKVGAIQFWKFSSKEVKKILKNNLNKTWIVHEYLSGITNGVLKLSHFKNYIAITSLYSVEWQFIKNRGWLDDKYGRQLIGLKQSFGWYKKSVFSLLLNFISWWGSHVIFGNSADVTTDFQAIFISKATYVVGTSINASLFSKDPTNKPEKNHILYLGRVNPPKGVGLLLAALADLRTEGTDINLTIIGDTWDFEKKWYKNLLELYGARKYAKIIPRVSQDQMNNYLGRCDFLVLPSFYEGSPRIIKEALSSEVLCLCSTLSGTKIIDSKEESILYFRRGDKQDLKKKLSFLLNSLTTEERTLRIKRGKEKSRYFSPEFVASTYAELYKEIYFNEHSD